MSRRDHWRFPAYSIPSSLLSLPRIPLLLECALAVERRSAILSGQGGGQRQGELIMIGKSTILSSSCGPKCATCSGVHSRFLSFITLDSILFHD